MAAIRDLQILPFAEAAPVLAETLKASQPPAVQVAALESLGRFGDERVPGIDSGRLAGHDPEGPCDRDRGLLAATTGCRLPGCGRGRGRWPAPTSTRPAWRS